MVNQKIKQIIFYATSFILLLATCLIISCSQTNLPNEILYQYQTNNNFEIIGDSVRIELKNPLKCPLRIWVQSPNESIKDYFQFSNPITLNAESDSIIKVFIKDTRNLKINFPSRFGDTEKVVKLLEVSLPFYPNYQYKIIQGNHGKFSHSNDYSRFAIDFNMKTGDTICAISKGFVVGVIEDYQLNGKTEIWRDYGNLITIYHPASNTFSQYVHLNYKGSLVELGQKVEEGEPIGISGSTGFSTIEHLHLNLSKPINSQKGLISIPIKFKEGYLGEDLKKGDIVVKTERN